MTERFSKKPSYDEALECGKTHGETAVRGLRGYAHYGEAPIGQRNDLHDFEAPSGLPSGVRGDATPGSRQSGALAPGIEPDSLSGVVFALEGTEGTTVLLNGPTGCKCYHSSISDSQTFRQFEFDPLNFPLTWYFGQPRVPCTYLDNGDYVYGSERKLEEALEYFGAAPQTGMLCIVNSPGAALIGDDLEGIARRILGDKPFMTLETPGFSEGMCAGFEKAACALADCLADGAADAGADTTGAGAGAGAGERGREATAVNVLGLSLYQRHYAGDVAELRRLLETMGLRVNCMLGAGGSIDEVRALPHAALNIVVHPELGLKTAQHLEERFGTPYFTCDGLPIGFDATERFARSVARLAGADAEPVLAECRDARKRAFSFVSRLNSLTGLPTGVPFAVEGTYSELAAYTEFLLEYLALVPVALVPAFPQADCARGRLQRLLDEAGFADALGRDPDAAAPELFFGSGATIARLRLAGLRFSGVETMLPTLGYLDVVPKTHLGPQGALHLVESVLNGLLF